MHDKEVEDWIESLSKKHTKKVTGSIHQKELKERPFVNGLLNSMEISIKDNPDASATKIRLRVQKVLADSCRSSHGGFQVKTFELDNFLMGFKKEFNINGLKNGI